MAATPATDRIGRADPTLDALAIDSEASAIAHPLARPGRAHTAMLVLAVVSLLVTTTLLFYVWRLMHVPAPVISESAAPPSTPTAPAPPVVEEAAIAHPIEDARLAADAASDQQPLPALADSDAMMQGALATLFGRDAIGPIFRSETVVHRFVATIDSLPRKPVSLRLSPLNPAAGAFITSGRGDELAISESNAARYTPFARMVDAVDAKKLVAAYVHAYPLFQQAYRDLGYPKGYFNDRLVEAIDDLLAAPRIEGPVRLVQPKVLYQFADPDLEARSAGQKMMLRMGADNEARIKGKLRELRHELTGKYPQG